MQRADRQRWIDFGVNMILRARWTYIPASVVADVQAVLIEELGIYTRVGRGPRKSVKRLSRIR